MAHVLVLPPVGGDGNSVVVVVIVGALLHVDDAAGVRSRRRQRATNQLSPRRRGYGNRYVLFTIDMRIDLWLS